ncbi:MAG: bifunctional diaminohydroxyphosphoribosylaminopyrimidine deaminase/5-amino-6-(5-phosphoribosylamino)uracil reductase RibD [Arsenophonus sp.]|nr:MAG: bifunctional diaminohydroxyphosphoribosylaminopyrimidine deaminase/5-amino-6-(5-phosphoribosylamino)uracil reductase RibD [Arsenophonus sp.]
MIKYDIKYMERALKLAKKGEFTTSPNPNVGCVIVKNNLIVGEGFHYKRGNKHAEQHALKIAKEKAKGSTVYITLEPCNHYGQTPPCTQALIKAKVKYVIVAMQDPNPKISGKGLLELEKAGIEIYCGLLQKKAEKLNKFFIKRMRTGFPYIILKLASSLDGKTALQSGISQWITSTRSRQDVQEIRSKVSAILTSSKTILKDNPNLNVRWTNFSKKLKNQYLKKDIRQPIRIVLDRQNQVNPEHNITKNKGECWLIRTIYKNSKWIGKVKQIIYPKFKNEINLVSLLKNIAKKNINSVLIESGPTLSGAFLKSNLVDELIVYIAPKIIGLKAKELITVPTIQDLKNVIKLKFVSVKFINPDLKIILHPKK